MADTKVIKAELRTEFGKGAARRLRRDFRLPGVLYASHQEPIHFHADLLEIHTLLRYEGVNAVFELEIDGEQYLSMVKVIDQNVLTLDVDHLDLLAIKRGEKVEVEIPVIVEGEPAPGSMYLQEVDSLLVEAPALSIPEEFKVDIEGAEIGTQITAADISLPQDVTMLDDAETLVVNITEEEVAEEPEEEDAEGAEGEANESAEGESEE